MLKSEPTMTRLCVSSLIDRLSLLLLSSWSGNARFLRTRRKHRIECIIIIVLYGAWKRTRHARRSASASSEHALPRM